MTRIATPVASRTTAIAVVRQPAAAAFSWLRARSRMWWVGAVLSCVAIFEVAQTGATFVGFQGLIWYHQDFPAFYTAAHLVARGQGELLYDTAAMGAAELDLMGHPVGGTGVLAYFNPPFFALLLVPLTPLPFQQAYQAWTLFSIALLTLDLWMLWRITRHLDLRLRVVLLLGFSTLFPIAYGLHQGQFSLILATSWFGAYVLLRSGRDALAGVALAPLLIKPELLIPVAVYLAWKRRWRAFATLLPLSAAAVIASVLVVGMEAAIDYPFYLADSTRWEGNGVTTKLMFGWNGIAGMIWSDPQPMISHAVVALLAMLTLVTVAHGCRGGYHARHATFPAQWLLLTIATILVDPHFYLQDTILLALPAIAAVATSAREHGNRMATLLLIGWAVLALGTFPNQHLHLSAFTFYMIAMALGALLLIERARRLEAKSPEPVAPATG